MVKPQVYLWNEGGITDTCILVVCGRQQLQITADGRILRVVEPHVGRAMDHARERLRPPYSGWLRIA